MISVFGSSTPLPGSKDYRQAQRVGQLLAEAGFAVATGGYAGTMAAVSQGAAGAGGHVIGVTAAQIERWRPLAANDWVGEIIQFDSLRERLLHLVTVNDGMIVLPGGIGTLSEFSLAWSFIQVGEMPPKPLVLLGPMWRATIEAFVRPAYVAGRYLKMLHFADSPEAAVEYMRHG